MLISGDKVPSSQDHPSNQMEQVVLLVTINSNYGDQYLPGIREP